MLLLSRKNRYLMWKFWAVVWIGLPVFQQTVLQAQMLRCDRGVVVFRSEAPLEVIQAESYQLRGVIDTLSRAFAWRVRMSSFEGFNSPLQREHFNEDYMEEDLAAAVLRIRPPATGYDGLIRSFQASPASRYLRRMLIRIGQVFKLVDVNKVANFFTQEKITFVVSRNVGKRLPVEYSLERLEQLLDPKRFFRINRQFIIHISAIREMHAHSKSRIKVVLDPPALQDTIVSVERSAAFKRWLLEADT